MEMGSHVWEMFVWTKQGNITTSAPPLELSRLNCCQQLAVTVVRTTHEKLLFTSAAHRGPWADHRGPLAAHNGLPTAGCGLPTVGRGLTTVGRGLTTVGCGLPTVSRGLPTVGRSRTKCRNFHCTRVSVYSVNPISIFFESFLSVLG